MEAAMAIKIGTKAGEFIFGTGADDSLYGDAWEMEATMPSFIARIPIASP
jgi:hypothetical protein